MNRRIGVNKEGRFFSSITTSVTLFITAITLTTLSYAQPVEGTVYMIDSIANPGEISGTDTSVATVAGGTLKLTGTIEVDTTMSLHVPISANLTLEHIQGSGGDVLPDATVPNLNQISVFLPVASQWKWVESGGQLFFELGPDFANGGLVAISGNNPGIIAAVNFFPSGILLFYNDDSNKPPNTDHSYTQSTNPFQAGTRYLVGTAVTPIPEPSTYLMLGSMLCLALLTKRKKKVRS